MLTSNYFFLVLIVFFMVCPHLLGNLLLGRRKFRWSFKICSQHESWVFGSSLVVLVFVGPSWMLSCPKNLKSWVYNLDALECTKPFILQVCMHIFSQVMWSCFQSHSCSMSCEHHCPNHLLSSFWEFSPLWGCHAILIFLCVCVFVYVQKIIIIGTACSCILSNLWLDIFLFFPICLNRISLIYHI